MDDETPAHTLIETYLSAQADLFTVVDHCYTVLEAYQFLGQNSVDAPFLDAEMLHLTGLELLRTLTQKPLVILTTAHSEFAPESYDFGVLDYPLKPVTLAWFIVSMEKIKGRLATQAAGKTVSTPRTSMSGPMG